SAASICAAHLSRFAEEIVNWSLPSFGFVKLSDRFTTGSSIMPQKRNPDAAELVRGKAGRIFGALMQLLVVMKGLPLANAKDLQEDKEATFDALATLSLGVAAMTGMVKDLEPDAKRMEALAGDGYSTATDLADWLVQKLDIPFREAHEITGKTATRAAKAGQALHLVPLADMQAVDKRITKDVFKVLTVARSVASRRSYGGTSPANVRREASKWLKKLGRKA